MTDGYASYLEAENKSLRRRIELKSQCLRAANNQTQELKNSNKRLALTTLALSLFLALVLVSKFL